MGMIFGESRQAFPEPPIPAYPGAPTGKASSPFSQSGIDSGLAVPAVWACVGLISNTLSSMALDAFRKQQGVSSLIDSPPIVEKPAAGFTQSEWISIVVVSLLLRGNAYGRITELDNAGRPLQMVMLNPDAVTPVQDADTGVITYKVRRKGGGFDLVPDRQMFHVRGLTLPGSIEGLSPISYAAASLGIDLASRQFATDFFTGASIPKAAVTSDQPIDQIQATTIKQRIMAAMSGREPIVMGAGLKFESLQVKPEESQFLETQKAGRATVAGYFWVAPEKIGAPSGNSMTYANIEQASIDFLTYSLAFWMKRIEDSFYPLLPGKQFIQFNVSHLLRTDSETQTKIHVQEIASKVKTPTEVRAEKNMPPMTKEQKAEIDMVPLTVTPLGGAKALPAISDPGGEPAKPPTESEEPE